MTQRELLEELEELSELMAELLKQIAVLETKVKAGYETEGTDK